MQKVSTEVLLYSTFFCFFFAPTYAYGQVAPVCDSAAPVVATLNLEGTVTGSIGVQGGRDRFQIDAAADINVEITAEFTNKPTIANTIILQLCNSSHDLIASESSDSSEEEETELTVEFRLRPGTYYVYVGLILLNPAMSPHPIQYSLQFSEDVSYNEFLSDCEGVTTTPVSFNDPLYGCQWYMKNRGGSVFEGGTAGEDINVEDVWLGGTTGSGINVAVVDTGMDFRHEDLADNVNTALNHSYTDGSIYNPASDHGTVVAGMIAAVGGNGTGIRGTAPQATIYGYNFLENSTVANIADAMTRNLSVTAVSNNSWGWVDDPGLKSVSSSWEMAVEQGVTTGFGGKGIFYSWVAGNGDDEGDQANFEEYNNYYAITSACSVDKHGVKSYFSEEGVNLWVCAPGTYILTSSNGDKYYRKSGTSMSTPMVSGVAALVRETNSQLSWRDVKLILADSARKNDESDPGWETVGVKYGLVSERYNYNSKYGFGVVDAERAVTLTRNWIPVPVMRTLTVSSDDVDQEIPDLGNTELTLTLPESSFFIEFVEIGIMFSHPFFPDLSIDLISPTGTVSELVRYRREHIINFVYNGQVSYTDYSHRFGSAKHLGETSSGEWTLRISDNAPSDIGTLHSWSIKVYGHDLPSEPTFGAQTISDQQYVQNSAINSITLPRARGGDGPLNYSLSPLPDGLVFDRGTRVLSGTPTMSGSTELTYTARDADGDETTLKFNMIEILPRPTILPSNPVSTPGSDTGGGGGGCTVSGHSSDFSGLLGAAACLLLIPLSVAVRRKNIRYQVKNIL